VPDIDIGRARRLAIDRIRTVLRHDMFATQVQADATFFGIQKQPAPLPRHVFATDPDPRVVEDVQRNTGVALYVWPESPRTVRRRKSAGVTRHTADSVMQVGVVCIYRQAMQVPPDDPDGLPLDADELMRLRGEAYAASIVEIVTTYAADSAGEAIHELTFERDDATPIYVGERALFGVAQATFTVRQEVSIPNRLALP